MTAANPTARRQKTPFACSLVSCIDWYIYGVRQARIGKSVAVITAKSKQDCKGLSYPYWTEAKKSCFYILCFKKWNYTGIEVF